MAHKVDVIIPMYNRANCVVNIISELEKQTFKDFRAIFVDDGSKDNTYDVLTNELKNATFDYEVIKKENGGAGSARNTGMRAADAEWIAFVDSDDGLKPEFLEYLYTSAVDTNSDLAICNLKIYPPGEKAVSEPTQKLEYRLISSAQAMKIFCTKWIGPVCFFISRKIIQSDNLFFDEECIFNEDAPFLPTVINAADKVAYIEQELYFYYTHPGSLHRSPSLDKFLSAIKSFSITEEKLLKSDNQAAAVFNDMGSARFYIATLRRAAVHLSYKDFKSLEKKIKFKRFKKQIKNLSITQRIACYILFISKLIFYYGMKLIFKD